jgi:signal transduction histidine kinase
VPIRDSDGKVVRWFGTNTDVTDEIEARAEAERRREALELVTESRTRLMRGFSHDVKNPLGAADGYAALLEEGIGGALTDAQRRSVERIRRSIQVSLHLIDDLLELARAEAGQIELEIERVDAAALAREVAEDFRGQVSAAGLSLEVRALAPLPVDSDPTRVRQIVSNLVSNAVKYTRAGRVTVDASRRGDDGAPHPGEWAVICVADTGPGIPEDKRQTIFQEFTRLDPNAPHGAGVGLAISRRIACLLGGDVTVESEVGRGSTFTLWLPCASTSSASA